MTKQHKNLNTTPDKHTTPHNITKQNKTSQKQHKTIKTIQKRTKQTNKQN